MTFKNTSTGNIYCDNYGTSSFHDSLIVNSTGGGDIIFGMAGGITTLDTSIIMIGSSGFSSSGELYLGGIKQLDATKIISLNFTGTAEVRFLTGDVFEGKLTVSAPHLFLDGGRFLGVTTLTHTGTNTNTSIGSCYFGDSTTIIHHATSGSFYLGVTKVDTFDAPVTILNDTLGKLGVIKAIFYNEAIFIDHAKNLGGVGTAVKTTFLVGDAGSCTFHNSLTLKSDSADIVFGTSAGAVEFKDSAYINIDSSYIGSLKFMNTKQLGSHVVIVPFENNSGILYLDSASEFNAAVTCHVKRVQLNGTKFNSSFYLIRNGTDNDTSAGGNTFNGYTTIIDSNSTTGKILALANKYTDDFNGQVTFRQYGIGKILPAHTKNSTFAGDIVVDGNSDITFGYGGGKVILDGTADRVLSKLGSNYPILKKLEMKKNAGTFTLTMPLTVSDSVIFTKGYLVTDSVHQLIIPDNGVVSGASDSSFVIGSVMKSGNDAFTFPIGAEGLYHPLSISAPTSGTFTARYIFGSHGLSPNADSTIENESLCEYWKVIRDTGSSKVKVRLGWNTNSCNVFGLDSMHVALWDTTNHIWKDKGNGGTTGSLAVGSVISNDSLSLFGIITLSDLFCTSLHNNMAITNVRCNGGSDGQVVAGVYGATPSYSYFWSGAFGTTNIAINLSPGVYLVQIADARACTRIDTFEIVEPLALSISVSLTTNSTCGDSIGLAIVEASDGVGNYSYLWSPYGGADTLADSLVSGKYIVAAFDSNGCVISTEVLISDSTGPSVSTDSLRDVTCFGMDNGYADISVTTGAAPFTYLWLESGRTDSLADNLRAGINNVQVEDTNGCKTFYSVTINEPDSISLNVTVYPSLCGQATGIASTSAAGGTGSLNYLWSTSSTTAIDSNLFAGNDTIVVTDDSGCVAMEIARIYDSNGPSVSASVIENCVCFGISTGIAKVVASGGTTPYSYEWLPSSQTIDTAIDLEMGTYVVIVTDSNGCKSQDSIYIDSPPPIEASIYATNASDDTTSDATAQAIVQGGTPSYSYYWTPGGATSTFRSGVGVGFDTLVVTDGNGCVDSAFTQIKARGTGNGCSYDFFPCISSISMPTCGGGCTFTVKNLVTDFYADPTGTYNSHCAFEAASNYFNANTDASGMGGNGLLFIPDGTYIVGYQEPNIGYYLEGRHVICLNNCHNFSVEGELKNGIPPLIKYEDCLRYGKFDPSNGDVLLACPTTINCPGCVGYGIDHIATIGNFANVTNCDGISFLNLQLNGNLDNAILGGYVGSDAVAINADHDAFRLDASYNIRIQNVNAHHFGRDGIQISDLNQSHLTNHLFNIHISNSKFNWNGRSGMSWVGGGGVTAIGCDFNYTSQGRLASRNSDGLDIEWEAGNSAVYGGTFVNCSFLHNRAVGIESYNSWKWQWVRDFYFFNCTVKASERSYAATLNARKFKFDRCHFFGSIDWVYDASSNIVNQDHVTFSVCDFNEEDNQFSYSRDALDECGTGLCNSPNHSYLLEINQTGQTDFSQCTILGNKQSRLILATGGWGVSALNHIKFKSCNLISTGMSRFNPVGCVPYNFNILFDIASIYKSTIQGSTKKFPGGGLFAWYVYDGLYPPVVNNNWNIGNFQYQLANNVACHGPVYTNPTYLNRVNILPPACTDVTHAASCPTVCNPPCNLREQDEIRRPSLTRISLSPVPSSESITLTNLDHNGEIWIQNAIGEILFRLSINNESINVDISGLAPGIYIIKGTGYNSVKFVKM